MTIFYLHDFNIIYVQFCSVIHIHECYISGVTCTKSVDIRMYGVTVKLLRGMPPKVDNYTVRENTYRVSGLTITKSGLWVFVYSSRLKMTVQYDEGMLSNLLQVLV